MGVVHEGEQTARGRDVAVAAEDAPSLPEGRYYSADLLGLEVLDESGRHLGQVQDVVPTGGVDLLSVAETRDEGAGRPDDPQEILIPMTAEIVLDVDRRRRQVRVRLPEGLETLNRRD